LADKELFIVATNAAERELATAKYNGLLNNTSSVAKSKSKSPRRRKREHGRDPMPNGSLSIGAVISGVAASHATTPRQKTANGTSQHGSKGKHPSSRRPHTSAGPRDKTHTFDRFSLVCVFDPENEKLGQSSRRKSIKREPQLREIIPADSGTARMQDEGRAPEHKSGLLVAPPLATTESTSSGNSSGVEGGDEAGDGLTTPDHLQVWGEEPVKLESQRRYNTDMLGFAHKLKRITADRFAPRQTVFAQSER
jgi:hypothetical protein